MSQLVIPGWSSAPTVWDDQDFDHVAGDSSVGVGAVRSLFAQVSRSWTCQALVANGTWGKVVSVNNHNGIYQFITGASNNSACIVANNLGETGSGGHDTGILKGSSCIAWDALISVSQITTTRLKIGLSNSWLTDTPTSQSVLRYQSTSGADWRVDGQGTVFSSVSTQPTGLNAAANEFVWCRALRISPTVWAYWINDTYVGQVSGDCDGDIMPGFRLQTLTTATKACRIDRFRVWTAGLFTP